MVHGAEILEAFFLLWEVEGLRLQNARHFPHKIKSGNLVLSVPQIIFLLPICLFWGMMILSRKGIMTQWLSPWT